MATEPKTWRPNCGSEIGTKQSLLRKSTTKKSCKDAAIQASSRQQTLWCLGRTRSMRRASIGSEARLVVVGC